MSPQPATDHPDAAVRREVVLDAPIDEVWRAMRDDSGLTGWLADEVDLDVVPGATGTVRDGDGPRRAVRVDEVRDGRGVALVWADEAGVETLVDIALTPEDGAPTPAPDGGTSDDGPTTDAGRRDRRGRTRLVVVELPVVAVSAVSVLAARSLIRTTGGASSPTASAPAGAALAGVR